MNINNNKNSLICNLGLILSMIACDPPQGKQVSDVMVAGEVAGSEIFRDEGLAGETQAGEIEAGETQAGEIEAGETQAGEIEAGETQAGEIEAGEMMAGEMMAGEMMAGEMMAGVMMAGEMMAGDSPVQNVCDLYCELYLQNCSAQASAKWGDDENVRSEQCQVACGNLPEGEQGDETGDQAHCALSYVSQYESLGERACLIAGLNQERPCFNYDAEFAEQGSYSQVLGLGEIARIRFTLSEEKTVRLSVTDDDYCLISDFRFELYSMSDLLNPESIVRVDDYDTENLDYCPVWLGELAAGVYELEIGTYQDQGAEDAFSFELSQPVALELNQECTDNFERPLAACGQGQCINSYCTTILGEGDECEYEEGALNEDPSNGQGSLCAEGFFCYGTSAQSTGQCTVFPVQANDLCHPNLSRCPDQSSCVFDGLDFRCQDGQCGDGFLNNNELCDDGNINTGDGCNANCEFERRRSIAESADSIEVVGMLGASSPTWARPGEFCQELVPQSDQYFYDRRVLMNETGSDQTLTIHAFWEGFDGFLHVYQGDLDAGEINLGEPTTACLSGNDDALAGQSQSIIYNIDMESGDKVTVVASTYECCYVDPEFSANYQLNVISHGCGDSLVQIGEECDDGNIIDGDRCSSTCTNEPYCGDGILAEDEVCDDGNNVDNDGCSTLCEIEELQGILVEVPNPGVTVDPHGAIIEGSPSWQRPGSGANPCSVGSGELYAFQYYTLTNNTGFDQVLDFNLIPESEFEDFYFHIFSHPFNPTDNQSICLNGADGGGVRFVDDRLENYALAAGERVSLIVSAYDPIDSPFAYPGSFQFLITSQIPPLADACNLIRPEQVTRVEGESFDAVTRIQAVGISDQSPTADEGVFVDIGYGPVDTDPNTDANLALNEQQWTWFNAEANLDWNDEGSDWVGYDEYQASITADQEGNWEIAARVSLQGQAWLYCDLGPMEAYQSSEAGQLTTLAFTEPKLLINEIDYDQEGGDFFEFIELYNPGPAQIDLNTLVLSLFDGDTNSEYYRLNLSADRILAAGEYFLVGNVLVTDFLPVGTRYQSFNEASLIDNGGITPDAIRIETNEGQILDSLSYEGSGAFIEGYTETNGVVTGDEPNQAPLGSLSRCPNGNDTQDNLNDFALSLQSTPGTANDCP